MTRVTCLVLASLFGLSALAVATPQFGYDHSDSRTLLTDDPVHFGDFPAALWSGSLKTDANDAPIYLNNIAMIEGAGWDPNISDSFEPALDYFDTSSGTPVPGFYNFGDPIPGGVNWSIREIASFDNAWNLGTPAPGVYDFTIQMIGGDSPTATDVLASFDLHLEVAERLDVDVTATATPINDPHAIGHVNLTVRNDMGRDLAITSAFMDADAFGSGLKGSFVGSWDGLTVAPGESLTKAHSNWRTNGTPANGTYYGGLGVVGGLHDGDMYYLYATPHPSMIVQGVPEPASMLPLALVALGLVRRRRKA